MSIFNLQGQLKLQGSIISSNIDPAAIAYFAAVVANGGSIGESAQYAVNNFIVGLKTDGIWPLIFDMGLFAGVDQLAGAVVKVKTPLTSRIIGNTNFASGDYVSTGSTAGLKGIGSSKYLNTGYNPGTTGTNPQSNSLTDFGIFAYWSGTETSTAYVMGIQQSSVTLTNVGLGWSGAIPNKEGGTIGGTNITTELAPTSSPTSLNGPSFVTTNGNRSQYYYNKGIQVSTPVTATGTILPPDAIIVGAMGQAAAAPYLYSTRYIRGYAITQGLNATQAQNLSDRWNILMAAFGANTY